MAAKAKLQPVQKSAIQLAKEVAAAATLRETLATLTDDAETIRDTIEGETDLHEAIKVAAGFVLNDEMLLAGIKTMQETLAARKERIENRRDFYKAAIEQAMLIAELPKVELPDGTYYLRTVPPKLEVTDEAKIASIYFTQQDPVLDRKGLLAVLKTWRDACAQAEAEGTEPPPPPVEGAELTAEGVTLALRRA